MVLSALFLTDVANVNTFQESSQLVMSEGDSVTVYLQLRDISVNTYLQGFKPAGRRYTPTSGASLKVYIDCSMTDASKLLVKSCSQPFPNDPSIWSFNIQSTDPVKGTKNIRLELKEGSKVTRGIVQSAIKVYPVDTISGSTGPNPATDYPFGI